MLGQSRTSPKRSVEELIDKGMALDDHDFVTYDSDREEVVTLSLKKLQRNPDHLKPSLRRFVLISNTLRHIKKELDSEGRVFDSERLGTIIRTQLVPEESPFLEFFGATDVGRVCVHICKLERGSFADFVRTPRVTKCGIKSTEQWQEAIAGENHDRTPSGGTIQAASITPPSLVNLLSSSAITGPSSLVSLLTSATCSQAFASATCGQALKPNSATSELTPLDIPDIDVAMFDDVDVSQYDYDGSDRLLPTTNPKASSQDSLEDDWWIKLQAENLISSFSSETGTAGEVIC